METHGFPRSAAWRCLPAAILILAFLPAPAARAELEPRRGPVVRAIERVLGRPPAARGQPAARDVMWAIPEMEACRAVHRYFPLHDGDLREFEGEGGSVALATRATEFNGQPVFALDTGGGEDYVLYAENQVLLLGESVSGYMDIVFETPVVWLTESMALSGGRLTSSTRASVWGVPVQIRITVELTPAADVVVPAGTYGQARTMTVIVTASVPGRPPATTRQRMMLAPEVGICRMTPTDQLDEWTSLVSGTVGGVEVDLLAAPSQLASPFFTRVPVAVAALAGSTAVLQAAADGAPPLRYQWTHAGTNLMDSDRISGATSASLSLAWVEPGDAGLYALEVRNDVGCQTSAGVGLTVLPDKTRPVVAFLSPRPNARVTNATAVVRIRANDNVAVREVFCQREGEPWSLAMPGEEGWEVPVTWTAGTNRLRAYAVDGSGHVSVTQSMSLVFVVPWPLDLAVVGQGRLVPDRRGTLLEVGRGYAMTAVPGPGYVFSNWVGGVTSSEARISFLMQSNLVLQANFVPDPFRALRGSYQGLFYDTQAPAHENAGRLALTVTERGTFSGRLTQGRVGSAFSGRFDLNLAASNVVTRPGRESWQVQLGLVAGTDRVEGTVAAGGWTSACLGFRSLFHAVTNPATHMAGRYTAALGSGGGEEDAGGVSGVGTLYVNAAGGAQWSGVMADGTPVGQGAAVALQGGWPLYVSLYGGQGSVFGWMALTPEGSSGSDVEALDSLRWTKPGGLGGMYPDGLTNTLTVVGSRYRVPRRGELVLPLTNGVVLLAGGGLPLGLTNRLTLAAGHRFLVDPPNPQDLTLSLLPATGWVGGSFRHPATGLRSSIKSVVIQSQVFATGFFLGSEFPGMFYLGPSVP